MRLAIRTTATTIAALATLVLASSAQAFTIHGDSWTENGKTIRINVQKQAIGWGNQTFTTANATVTCRSAEAENIETKGHGVYEGGKPVGEDREAVAQTIMFQPLDCMETAGSCTAQPQIRPSGFPWSQVVEGSEATGYYKSYSGVHLTLECPWHYTGSEIVLETYEPITAAQTASLSEGLSGAKPTLAAMTAPGEKGTMKLVAYEGTPLQVLGLEGSP